MPSFLTRLRSLRKPKATSTPTIRSIESNVVPQYHDEQELDVQKAPPSPDASSDSPRIHTAEVELDSKIHPDLSALFASVEDALRTVERAVEVKKRGGLAEETDSDDGPDRERRRAARERTRTNELDGTIYASYGSSMGTGGSAFEQEDTPCPPESRKTHIANPLHLHRNHRFDGRANDHPSSADAVLSWSPKQIFESSDSDSLLLSPRPSSFSGSHSLALLPSPEIQERDNSTRQNSYYSPSPGTFGYPTPPNTNFIQTDSPNFPPPVFHSTPKTSSARSRAGARRRSPRTRRRTVGSARTPPVPQNSQAMKGTAPDKVKPARKTASVSAFDSLESTRVPLRASGSVSRAVNRRKSAEWNAHAASAGVVADPQQTTEFGWPAEVSREILRLSLGDELTFNAHNTLATAPVPVLPAKAEPQHLKRGLPRVSHEYKSTAIRPSILERRPPSAFLYSTTLPQSPSPSTSAPRRSDRQAAATKPPSAPHGSGVAAAPGQETATSRAQSESASGDNALDKKKLSDSNMGAAGAPERKRHFGNDNSIDWESAELQEFISREESRSFASGDVHALQPSTPMKKSESGSTYQTAGSSSYLQAPSLSVIAPTPRSSPGNSRHSSGVSPETAEGLHVPHPPPQTEKSKGKRKADESEEGSPPDLRGSQGKKTSFATEVPRCDSDAPHAPSSFQSFLSQKSRKRVRLSSPMATPDQSRPGSAAPHHVGSAASSRGSSRSNLTPAHFQAPPDTKGSHHPRPPSRTSRASRQMSTAPSGGGSSMAFPGRRSLSQSSIPISAIVTPRAPSVSYMSSFHMRDPRRPPPQREVGWTLRLSSADDNGSPFMAWAFWFGFLLPLLWWIASFWRIPQTRMVGTDTEKAVIVDDPFYEREARVWRLRCRVASALFFVTYVPVIVLIAVLT